MTPELLTYIRKLSKADTKTLTGKALKTQEEVGELAKWVLPFDNAAGTTHRFVGKERIVEEVADTILCALSVAYDVGATDEEIAAMMMHKAQYWEELQLREVNIKYPLPYEVHITISAGTSGIVLEDFKSACAELGVKPLLIDMHNRQGETVMLDSQTSSIFMGDNRGAITECRRIAAGLRDRGFEVVREKIETVPWHPAAPSDRHARPKMPRHCYFEAHFNIVVSDQDVNGLRSVVEEHGAHLSRNAFKRLSESAYVIMATLRSYENTYEVFRTNCDDLVSALKRAGFEVPKTITEFSIYDTKVSHDSVWLETA